MSRKNIPPTQPTEGRIRRLIDFFESKNKKKSNDLVPVNFTPRLEIGIIRDEDPADGCEFETIESEPVPKKSTPLLEIGIIRDENPADGCEFEPVNPVPTKSAPLLEIGIIRDENPADGCEFKPVNPVDSVPEAEEKMPTNAQEPDAETTTPPAKPQLTRTDDITPDDDDSPVEVTSDDSDNSDKSDDTDESDQAETPHDFDPEWLHVKVGHSPSAGDFVSFEPEDGEA